MSHEFGHDLPKSDDDVCLLDSTATDLTSTDDGLKVTGILAGEGVNVAVPQWGSVSYLLGPKSMI